MKRFFHFIVDYFQNLDMEMTHLYKRLKITDISLRLRYFTCHQLDLALQGLFRDVKALPFGSTVSGFGRNSGDLDIFLHFKKKLSQAVRIKDRK